jgi:hypothetical protein
MNDIPSKLFEKLPDSLKQVPAQVLDITGIETKAFPITAPFLKKHPNYAQAEAVIEVDAERQAITIWYDPNRATASSIGHELIHLRRDIVEAVPKLFPLRAADSLQHNDVFAFENELEHLIIVPEQLNAFPEALAWWVKHYSELVDRGIANDISLMFAWSFIRNVLPNEIELAKRYAGLLHKYEIAKPADYLRADLSAVRVDKANLIRVLHRFFKQIKSQVVVGQYAVVGRKLTVKPIDL